MIIKFDPSEKSPGLLKMLPMYTRINDCIAGSDVIKDKGVDYLPKPDPTNTTQKNKVRYDQYSQRALFYGITGRTVNGMVGLVYSKPQPTFEMPDSLSYLIDNIDGSGITLEQQQKKVIFTVTALGRSGLLTDYSQTSGEISQQDVIDGKVRAVITRYDATNILWSEYTQKGVESVLSLVILAESYKESSGDGYKTKTSLQYKVLRLNDGVYTQEVFRQNSKTTVFELNEKESSIPLNSKGDAFDHLPFTFVGSVNNDGAFDNPPMLSIADLNIAHFRNSADFEESCYMNGQPTYVFSGLTEGWVKDVLKGGVMIGSRGGVPLPEGASGNILQAKPNTMTSEAMATKESQMAAIGAQIVTGNNGATTATEINRDSTVEDSVLSGIVGNTEQAYNFCFEQVTLFTGIEIPKLEINKEFDYEAFNANDYNALVNGAAQTKNTDEDVFNYLKKTGMVNYDVEYDTWKLGITNIIPGAI